MSFILDALRKSDKRRRVNEAPDLAAASSEKSGPASGARRSRRGLVLVLLVLITLATAAYLQRDPIERQWQVWVGQPTEANPGRPDSLEPVVPLDGSAVDAERSVDPAVAAYRERVGTPRERLVTDPAAAQAEIERLVAEQATNSSTYGSDSSVDGQVIDRRSPNPSLQGQSVSRAAPARERPAAPSAEEVERIQRRLRESQRIREMESVASSEPGRTTSDEQARDVNDLNNETLAGGMTGTEQPLLSDDEADMFEDQSDAESDWVPEAAEYIRAWELPLSVRRSMPALTLNIHVFSEVQNERFVLINGERYIDGDELPDGARLVGIRREGAVVDYRDYRFLLEP